MESPFILRPASVNKTPLLLYRNSNVTSNRNISRNINRHRASRSASFAEVCGGTAAECTVVCCCCPCYIVELLVLAIYKVPASLCRRALRFKRKRRLLKKSKMQPRRRRCQRDHDETEVQIQPVVCFDEVDMVHPSEETEKAIVELEKEMWDKFYGGGFWRSISQREPPVIVQAINI